MVVLLGKLRGGDGCVLKRERERERERVGDEGVVLCCVARSQGRFLCNLLL